MSDDKSKRESTNATPVLQRDIFSKGMTIFKEGDEGYYAYYIESGSVEVFITDDEGEEVRLAELGDGDIFGEMALLDEGKRSATVRVKEDCTAVSISKEELEKRIHKISDAAIKALIRVLIKRIKKANQDQLLHHKDLKDFEKRIMGVMAGTSAGISAENRESFREEVMPLLLQIEKLLEKYRQ
jgi:CRP-like cAMP-binding protein